MYWTLILAHFASKLVNYSRHNRKNSTKNTQGSLSKVTIFWWNTGLPTCTGLSTCTVLSTCTGLPTCTRLSTCTGLPTGLPTWKLTIYSKNLKDLLQWMPTRWAMLSSGIKTKALTSKAIVLCQNSCHELSIHHPYWFPPIGFIKPFFLFIKRQSLLLTFW